MSEATEEIMHETEHLVEVLPPLHKNFEEFCIDPSDGTVAQCVEAFLESIIKEYHNPRRWIQPYEIRRCSVRGHQGGGA